MELNLANVEASKMVLSFQSICLEIPDLETVQHAEFAYLRIVTNFVVKNYSIAVLKTRYIKLSKHFYRLFLSQIKIKL